MKKTYDIYALRCPITKEVMYVGETRNLRCRISQHKSNLYDNPEKGAWVKDLKAQGKMFTVEVLQTVISETRVCAEEFWISYYKEKGQAKFNRASHLSLQITRQCRMAFYQANVRKKKPWTRMVSKAA